MSGDAGSVEVKVKIERKEEFDGVDIDGVDIFITSENDTAKGTCST